MTVKAFSHLKNTLNTDFDLSATISTWFLNLGTFSPIFKKLAPQDISSIQNLDKVIPKEISHLAIHIFPNIDLFLSQMFD